jgi:Protein of unknown function (DUF3606)
MPSLLPYGQPLLPYGQPTPRAGLGFSRSVPLLDLKRFRTLLGAQNRHEDDARINVDQDHELNYWSEKLGVSREQLRKAVQAAGPMVKDVPRHLNR